MELEKVLENYSGNLEKLVQYITGATPDLIDLETLALGSANSLQEEINARLATLREIQKRRGSQLLKQVTDSADPSAFDTSSFAKSLMRESLQVNFLRKDQTELQEELNALKQLHAGSKNPMEKFVEEIQAKVGVEGQKLEIEDSIEMLLVKKVSALEKKVASKFKKELDSVKHTVGVVMCDYLKKIEQLDLQCVSSKKLNEDTVQKLNHYMTLTRQFKKTQSLSQERYDHLTMLMSKLKETNYKVIRNLQKKLEAARRQLAEQGRFGFLLSNEEGGRDAADDEEYEYFTQSTVPPPAFDSNAGFKVGEDSSNLFDSAVAPDSRPIPAIPPAGFEYEEMLQESASYQISRKPKLLHSIDNAEEDFATFQAAGPEGEEFEQVQGRDALNILKRNEMGGAARLPKGMLERLQKLIAELEEREKQLTEALKLTQAPESGELPRQENSNISDQPTERTDAQVTKNESGEVESSVLGSAGKSKSGAPAASGQTRVQTVVLKETQYKNDQKALLAYIKQVEAERQKWAQSLARVQDLYRRTEADRQRRATQADSLALRLSRMLALYNSMRERNPDLLPDGIATEDTLEQQHARLVEEFEQLRAKDDSPVAKLQSQNSKLRYELEDLRKELRFREDELALKKAEIRKLYEMSKFGLTNSKAPTKGKIQQSLPSESTVAERLYAKTLQFNDDLKDQLMSQKKKAAKLEDELYDCKNRERRLEKRLQDLNGQQREVTYIVYAGKKVEIDDLEELIDDLNNTLQRKQQKIERLQKELLEAQEMMNMSYQSEGQDSEEDEETNIATKPNKPLQNSDPKAGKSPSRIVATQEDSLPPKPRKRRFESDKKQELQDYAEGESVEQTGSRRPRKPRPVLQDPTTASAVLAVSQPVEDVPPSVEPTPVVPARVVPVAPQYDPRILERANSLQQALDQMRREKQELDHRSQQAVQDYRNLQEQNEKLQTTTAKLQSQVAALQSQLMSNDSKVAAFADQLIKVNRENEGLKLINSQLDQAARQAVTTPRGDQKMVFSDKGEIWEGVAASGQPKPNSALEEDSLEETVIKVGKENQDLREKMRVLDEQLKNSQQTALLNTTTIKGLEARITELGNELAMKENQIKTFQTFNTKSMEKQATTVTDGAGSVVASPITRKKDTIGVQVDTLVDLQPQVEQAQRQLQQQDYELAELRKQLEELTEQYEYSEACLNELRQTLARVFAKKQYLINVLVNIEEDLYIGGRSIKRLDEAALERLLDEALEVVRGENQFRKSFTVPTKSSLDVVEIKLDTPKQPEFEVSSAAALQGSVENASQLNRELFRLGEEVARLRSIIQEYIDREEEFRRFAVDLVQLNAKNDPQYAEEYKRLLAELQNLEIEDEEDLRPSNYECFRQLLVYLNDHPGRGQLVDTSVEQRNKEAFEHQEPQDATYDDELLLEVLRQQHEFQSNMDRLLSQRLSSYRQTLENTRAEGADPRKVQHVEKLTKALTPFVTPADPR